MSLFGGVWRRSVISIVRVQGKARKGKETMKPHHRRGGIGQVLGVERSSMVIRWGWDLHCTYY